MAATTTTFSKAGVKAQTQVKLDPALFGIKEVNQRLLRQAYNAYLANGRINLAKTKTRGLISGGGRKPHPQKGTGRARSGSNRNPLWRGGGTIFGPTGHENYTQKLSTKAKRVAIIHALSALSNRGAIKVIEDINLKAAKTSELNALLEKIGANEGYSLIVTDSLSDQLKLASRNLSSVSVCAAKYLNVARLLDADTLILTKPALVVLASWLSPSQQAQDKSSGVTL